MPEYLLTTQTEYILLILQFILCNSISLINRNLPTRTRSVQDERSLIVIITPAGTNLREKALEIPRRFSLFMTENFRKLIAFCPKICYTAFMNPSLLLKARGNYKNNQE